MGKRYNSNEKENANVPDGYPHREARANESRNRRQDLWLLHKLRTRMQESRANVAKIRNNFLYMRRLIANCVDMVDKSMELVERENLESQEFSVQVTPCNSSDELQRSRHAVNPMIAGQTLKRASITLRRVSADGLLQFRTTQGSFPRPVIPVEVSDDSMLPIGEEYDLSSSIDSDEELSNELSNI